MCLTSGSEPMGKLSGLRVCWLNHSAILFKWNMLRGHETVGNFIDHQSVTWNIRPYDFKVLIFVMFETSSEPHGEIQHHPCSKPACLQRTLNPIRKLYRLSVRHHSRSAIWFQILCDPNGSWIVEEIYWITSSSIQPFRCLSGRQSVSLSFRLRQSQNSSE